MNYKKELEIAKKAVKSAGELVLRYFNSDYETKIKQDDTSVTTADIESNKLLESILLKDFTDYGIISEEKSPIKPNAKYKWVIDPIDGTRGFKAGIDEFCITVTLTKNNKPVVAVVYRPVTDELYHAVDNQGAFKNSEPIEVSQVECINQSRMLVSDSEFKLDYMKELINEINPEEVSDMGSTALKFCKVAEGDADFYITFGGNDRNIGAWDYLGPSLILKEAGGLFFKLNNSKHLPENRDYMFLVSTEYLNIDLFM
ncbi:3'(2'),5'-bisphosphate nucleotidase CysQ [Candidatus Woesearchaeota archaeon]|jgi:fructose-1,6-bisphosphatase/inositol monophosphatase family enzyme|nr:3'(2'),5'-bisphosphate nucleotidase CysQ [Candidatus Woesearchaeota archaeon]MBT6518575.1 3'(2'),5'-bisphosphate nucleotidase CysQ [Candidatus Woesearchaeota archaeon]MBT7366917.1 3'(2'),5'-bisphosphate nucleotidase CysQ [Candidatus Woesearchaeota archaeon]